MQALMRYDTMDDRRELLDDLAQSRTTQELADSFQAMLQPIKTDPERCPDCGAQLAACTCHLAPCDICNERTPHEELAQHARKGICDKCFGEMREPSNRERWFGLGTD
jgi:hypothetical protein